MPSQTYLTRDHATIRRWAEDRGGRPVVVKPSSSEGPERPRLAFPGHLFGRSVASVTWDDWFVRFDRAGLALLFRESQGGGKPSRFHRLMAASVADELAASNGWIRAPATTQSVLSSWQDPAKGSDPDPKVIVLNALRRITRALRVSATATHSTVGISAAQLYVLRRLHGCESASIGELAQATLTDRTSVSAVVERLVEQGLAVRSPAPEDRRRARVQITPEGDMVAVNGGAPTPLDLILAALETMSTGEIAALARSLEALVTAMQIESTPPEMLYQEIEALHSPARNP